MIDRRVAGLKVLITREPEDAERWALKLTSLGAFPILFPCLQSENITDPAVAHILKASVESANWIVLSSRRGVVSTARMLDGKLNSRTKIAVIGPATARAAKELLGRADLVATDSTSAGIADALLARLSIVKGSGTVRVVMAGAEGGRADVETILGRAGVKVSRVDVYRTVPSSPIDPKRDFEQEGLDLIFLASPSAVEGLRNTAIVPREAKVIVIGPTTAAAALEAGMIVAGEAEEPNLDSMLDAIE